MEAIHTSAGAPLLHFGCEAERVVAQGVTERHYCSTEKELQIWLLLSF